MSLSPQSSLVTGIFENSLKQDRKFAFCVDVKNGGKLLIGEDDLNLNKCYSDNLTHVNVNVTSSKDKWQFTLKNISIPDLSLCTDCKTIISSGIFPIIGPFESMQKFNKKFNLIDLQSDSELKYISCNSVSSLPSD